MAMRQVWLASKAGLRSFRTPASDACTLIGKQDLAVRDADVLSLQGRRLLGSARQHKGEDDRVVPHADNMAGTSE
jgi:hypothetical protein